VDAQKALRLSNCISLLTTIEKNEGITRKGISEKTGLSLMTVGKLCSLLCECDIITEQKEEKSESGRRASACFVSPSFSLAVINLADNTYSLTVYNSSARSAASILHTASAELDFEDRLYQFCDRMAEMLDRIEYPEPTTVCVISEGVYENGILTKGPTEHADLQKAVSKFFRKARIEVFKPSACAAAYVEMSEQKSVLAATIGKKLSFAVPKREIAPFQANAVYPDKLRVEDTSLGERLKDIKTPDKESIFAFLSSLAALYPEHSIKIFPLAESNGTLTCGEMCRYAIQKAEISDIVYHSEDPLGEMSDGARIMLVTSILKKHI